MIGIGGILWGFELGYSGGEVIWCGKWVESKNVKVFSLYSPQHPETEVDLFVEDMLGIEEAMKSAIFSTVAPGVLAPICGIGDLLKLKRAANRDRDRIDIEKLKVIYSEEA